MTHDFIGAAEKLFYATNIKNEIPLARTGLCGRIVLDKSTVETIMYALSVAEKLMKEPSDKSMTEYIENAVEYGERSDTIGASKAGFKAMRDQMLKEIENE